MNAKVVELRGQLNERRDRLTEIFEQAGPDVDFDKVTALEGDSAAKVEHVRALNAEITDIREQLDAAEELDAIRSATADLAAVAPHPGHATGNGGRRERADEAKSIGERFVASESYKRWQRGSQGQIATIEVPMPTFAATFTTTASTLTSYDRSPDMVLVGLERLTVADLLATGTTTANTIRYVREDTYTNAATTVTEGAAKPEATFDTSEADAPVRKIAVRARVTDEMFADFPMIRDYIDNRLRFMVAEREEAQLLNGTSTPPDIVGILQTAGIQTQAKAADTVLDAIYKGMTKIRSTGFFEPDGYVTHPDDWTDIRLLRTADGIYIWGHPSNGGPEMVWGMRVVVTTAIAANTSLVGAFKLGAQVFYREGLTVETTNSNEDDFNKNLISIRAEQREALAVYRPKAFCTITGI